MRAGPLTPMLLVSGPAVPWERDGHTFGVEIRAAGDQDAPVIVFGATEQEAVARAREVVAALALRRPRA